MRAGLLLPAQPSRCLTLGSPWPEPPLSPAPSAATQDWVACPLDDAASVAGCSLGLGRPGPWSPTAWRWPAWRPVLPPAGSRGQPLTRPLLASYPAGPTRRDVGCPWRLEPGPPAPRSPNPRCSWSSWLTPVALAPRGPHPSLGPGDLALDTRAPGTTRVGPRTGSGALLLFLLCFLFLL